LIHLTPPSLSYDAQLFLFSFLALLPVTFAAPTLDRRSTCPVPRINAATTNLIKGYEKFEAVAYKDQGGKWTIGYGHLCNPGKKCTEIKYPVPLSAVRYQYSPKSL
jgi:hypothetical protein